MKKTLLAFVALLAGMLAMSSPLFAHHGDAAYNSMPTIMKGAVVTEFTWMNPHSLLKFDYKNDKGVMEHWTSEIGSIPSMSLLGWSRTSFRPGDVITIYLFTAKTGNLVGRINKVVLADGTTLGDRDDSTPSRYGGDAGAGGGRGGR
jgi:hypothetical protein